MKGRGRRDPVKAARTQQSKAQYQEARKRVALREVGFLNRELMEAKKIIRDLESELAEWREKAANWLKSPEAKRELEGYRELSDRALRAEDELAELKARYGASAG